MEGEEDQARRPSSSVVSRGVFFATCSVSFLAFPLLSSSSDPASAASASFSHPHSFVLRSNPRLCPWRVCRGTCFPPSHASFHVHVACGREGVHVRSRRARRARRARTIRDSCRTTWWIAIHCFGFVEDGGEGTVREDQRTLSLPLSPPNPEGDGRRRKGKGGTQQRKGKGRGRTRHWEWGGAGSPPTPPWEFLLYPGEEWTSPRTRTRTCSPRHARDLNLTQTSPTTRTERVDACVTLSGNHVETRSEPPRHSPIHRPSPTRRSGERDADPNPEEGQGSQSPSSWATGNGVSPRLLDWPPLPVDRALGACLDRHGRTNTPTKWACPPRPCVSTPRPRRNAHLPMRTSCSYPSPSLAASTAARENATYARSMPTLEWEPQVDLRPRPPAKGDKIHA